MLPLAACLGASVGTSTILVRLRLRAIAMATPVMVAVFVTLLWRSSLIQHGADPSDWILYVPLLVGSAICFPVNIVMTVISRRRVITPHSVGDGKA